MRLFGGAAAVRTARWPFARPSIAVAYERAAAQWDSGGRQLLTGIAKPYALRLCLWVASPGARTEGVGPLVAAYSAAIAESMALWTDDWFHRALRDSADCPDCRQPWRLENLSLCTHCPAVFAPCCQRHYHIVKARNGNPECPICHTGELVG